MDIHDAKHEFEELMSEHGSETKVAGFFATGVDLEQTAVKLVEQGVTRDQMSVITPEDALPEQKVEVDSAAVKHDLWKFHVSAGVTGFGIGLVLAVLLSSFGPSLFSSSPLMTFIVLVNVGLLAGLLVGGIIALRPDQDVLMDRVRMNHDKKQWALVVRTASSLQREKILNALKRNSLSTSATL